jgi:prevent-host-death family protein
MTQVNVSEAKARFSELIKKALTGEEVIIARDGKRLVKLVPVVERSAKRRPGSASGQVWMADDFDATPPEFDDYS